MADPIQPQNKASQLRRLAQAIPAASQRVANQFQTGQAIQMQQAIQKAQPTQTIAPIASQLGAAVTQNIGQQMVESAQKQASQQQALGGMALEQQRQQTQQSLGGLRAGVEEQVLANRAKLANINEQAAREMFDSRLQFSKDELGRAFLNERQLADYARMQARSAEELKNYELRARNIERNVELLQKAAYDKISQALKDEQQLRELGYSAEQIQQLGQARAAMVKGLEKKRADAAARQGIWSVGGGIVGAVGGAIATGGNPAGAMAGYQVGSGLGQVAGSQT